MDVAQTSVCSGELQLDGFLRAEARSGRQKPAPQDDPAKIHDAASQFEALLLAEMLKSVREASGEGWLGAGGDEAGGMMLEVAQEHLAQVLAAQGGLGIARLVEEGLL